MLRYAVLFSALLVGSSGMAQGAEVPSDTPSQKTEATEAQSKVSDDEDAEARSLFQAGKTAYDNGRFESALDYFERSYSLSKRPELLFNIGSAADRLRMDEKALSYLKRYRERLPNAKNGPSVDKRIAVLEVSAKAKPKVEDTKRSVALPVLLLSFGVAATVTGAVLFGLALRYKFSIEGLQAGADWDMYRNKAQRVPTFSTAGLILMAVGVASTGLGLVVFAKRAPKKNSKRVELSFSGNGLYIAGEF